MILLSSLTISIFASDKEDTDVKKVSESIGHMIGKNLEDLGIELDVKELVEGIKKAADKNIKNSIMDETIGSILSLPFSTQTWPGPMFEPDGAVATASRILSIVSLSTGLSSNSLTDRRDNKRF